MRLNPLRRNNNRAKGFGILSLEKDVRERVFSERIVTFGLIFFVIATLAQSFLILVSWGKLPPKIPIFYSLPWGEDILVKPFFIWVLPALTVILGLLNFLMIWYLKTNKFLRMVIVATLFMVSFICIWDTTKIITLLV